MVLIELQSGDLRATITPIGAEVRSLSLRGVESRLATLYEKLFVSLPEGTPHEAYEKLAYNVRTRAFFEALRRGLLNNDELEKAAADLEGWLERDRKRFIEEQKREAGTRRK